MTKYEEILKNMTTIGGDFKKFYHNTRGKYDQNARENMAKYEEI